MAGLMKKRSLGSLGQKDKELSSTPKKSWMGMGTSDAENEMMNEVFDTKGEEREYQAVQIVLPDVDTNGGYCINDQEIERIFGQPSVANTPVAIYSTEDWLKSKEDKLNKGFIWRGGSERHTEGIWIWDEPYFIQTPKGEVALFLMDTEGAFDHQSTVKNCSVIFGLSTLLSSVQIYNVQNHIQEDTLQYLQLFTDYAKVAKQNDKDEEMPFQRLMFLIRDWSDKSFAYGFNGGNKYLRDVLVPLMQNRDTASVRNDFRKSFEKITCSLMPHPGYEVSERDEEQANDIKISDVRDIFLQTVDIMVRELFSPDKIVAKRINKKPVTGIDLINYTLSYFEVFSSGTMPEVQTIMQATAEAAILKVIHDCKVTYWNEMNSKLGNKYKSRSELNSLHLDSKTQALNQFDEQRKLGDKDFIAKYRKLLVKNIEQNLTEFEQLNKSLVENIKEEVRNVMEEAKNKYETCIEKYIGGEYVDESSLSNEDQKCKEEVLESFNTKTTNLPQEIAVIYKTQLKEQLAHKFDKVKENNKHKLERYKQQLERNSQNASNSYKLEMEEKTNQCTLSDDEFTDVHNLAENKALNEFDSAFTENSDDYKNMERNYLLKWIQQIKDNYQKSNETRRELALKKIISETLEDVKQEYVSAMTSTNFVEEGELEQLHLESKTNAETYLVSKDNLYEKCKLQFNAMIESEYREMKRVNRDTKIRFDQEGKNAVRNAKLAFEDCLRSSTCGKYVDQISQLEVETKSSSEAFRIFEEMSTNLPPEIKEIYRQELEETMNQQKDEFNRNNNDKLEEIKISLGKLTDLCYRNYVQAMKPKCAEQIMSDEDFNEAHKKANTEALDTFESSDVGLNTTERSETKEKLLLRINGRQSKFEATVEKNREEMETKTRETLKAAASVYSSKMKEKYSQGYVSEQILGKTSAKSKEKAMKMISSVKDKTVVNKCNELLEAIIDSEYEEIKMKNKGRMEQELDENLTKAMEFHASALMKGSGGKYMEERLMPGLEQSCRVQALQFLKNETKQYPGEVIANYQRELEILLYQEWKQFQEENYHKFVEMKLELEREVESASNKYQEIMQETCSNEVMTDEDFEIVHLKIQKEAMEEFVRSKVGGNSQLKGEEQKRLIIVMEQSKSSFRKDNEIQRRNAEVEALEKLEKAAKNYRLEIEKTCNDKYIDGEKLEQAHNESKEKAETIVTSFDKKHLIKDFMSKFEELIDNEYQKIQNKNKGLKDKAINEFRQRKLEAYESYLKSIDYVTQQYMNAEEMQAVHQQEIDKALEKYNRGDDNEPQTDFELLRNRLEDGMKEHCLIIGKRNNDLKWMLEEKGEKVLQSIKMTYIKLMDEMCNGTYVEPSALQATHQQFKDEVENRFTEQLGVSASDIVKKLVEKCHNELDEHFKSVEKLNENNKNAQKRKRRKKFANIFGGIGKLVGKLIGMQLGSGGMTAGGQMGGAIGESLGNFFARISESKESDKVRNKTSTT